MSATHLKLGPDGCVVIPPEYRRALRLVEGEELILSVEGNALHLTSARAALARARELFRPLQRGDGSVVEAFIAERREEAEREAVE